VVGEKKKKRLQAKNEPGGVKGRVCGMPGPGGEAEKQYNDLKPQKGKTAGDQCSKTLARGKKKIETRQAGWGVTQKMCEGKVRVRKGNQKRGGNETGPVASTTKFSSTGEKKRDKGPT